MSPVAARRAYSAEELLALRRSASDEPALAIQTKTRESVIKEHVIRGSRSFASQASNSLPLARGPQFSNHSRPLAVPVLGELDPNNQVARPKSSNRNSPTPSLKKRKAEQILEQHGSPPDLRVTAGGRIVPYSQSPLCSPRYGYSAIQKNGGLIKLAPGYPPPKTFQSFAKLLDNGFVAQELSGRLCQLVDGRFLPIHEVNGIPQLYITAPNLNNVSSIKQGGSHIAGKDAVQNNNSFNTQTDHTSTGPTIPAQLEALDKQYQKLEAERRSLDRAEVMQKMTGKSFNQLIQRRRQLVEQQNELRLSKKALQDAKVHAEAPHASRTAASTPETLTNPMRLPMNHNIPQLPMNVWNDNASDHAMNQMAFPPMPGHPDFGMFVPPPFYGPHMSPMGPVSPYFHPGGLVPGVFQGHGDFPGTGQIPNMQHAMPFVSAPNAPHHMLGPISTDAKSSQLMHNARATEINTASVDKSNNGQKSSLNPMSAVYEPSSKLNTPEKKAGLAHDSNLADAIMAHNDWADNSRGTASPSDLQAQLALTHHSSDSSYATADFFPQNPRDHSVNKQAYAVGRKSEAEKAVEAIPGSQLSSDDNQTSPEKERHNPNWNPTIPDHAFRAPAVGHDIPNPGSIENKDGSGLPLTESVLGQTQAQVGTNVRPGHLAKTRTDTEMAIHGSPRLASPASGSIERSEEEASATINNVVQATDEFIEGFRAGLARAPIGSDKGKIYLDGYCAGLRRSTEVGDSMQENISPHTRTANSETRVSSSSSVAKRIERRSEVVTAIRSTLETKTDSLDTLKQAMFGPSNENAVLSPNEEIPPVFTIPDRSLGSWPRNREQPVAVDSVLSQFRNGQANFPERTSSMVNRQMSTIAPANGNDSPRKPNPTASAVDPSGGENTARRDFSAATQPASGSYLQRAYGGHRVMSSPALEWKSGSSIAQVAGLATGYFAQYDGTLTDLSTLNGEAFGSCVTMAATACKSTQTEKETAKTIPNTPRFKEGSMPQNESPLSGPASQQGSPSKKTSPAKAKFAQIAGKAGIKVGAPRREPNETDVDAMSPQERRKWRDLWKKRHTGTAE